MVLCSVLKFGSRGLLFYVGAKGRYWSQISYRKLKMFISHDVVILASEPDAMLIDKIKSFSLDHRQSGVFRPFVKSSMNYLCCLQSTMW